MIITTLLFNNFYFTRRAIKKSFWKQVSNIQSSFIFKAVHIFGENLTVFCNLELFVFSHLFVVLILMQQRISSYL